MLWGRLADICGRRVIFRLGLVCTTLSCLISPFAPNGTSLDILRAIQGLGGAAATPSAVGITFATFPPGKAQIYAMSAFSSGFPLGNVVGNVLGGVIAQFLGWKWAFWIMSIVAACLTMVSMIVIPASRKEIELSSTPLKNCMLTLTAQMDWLGLTTSMVILMFLLVPLTTGNIVGWKTPWVIVLLAISVTLIPLFILWEIRLEKEVDRPPLIKMTIFESRTYCAAQMIVFIFWASFNNFMIFATYFYQDYLGLNTIQTTLRFLPTGITGIVAVYISSQILKSVNGNIIAVWGTICVCIPSLLFAVPIPTNTTYWAYGLPAMVVLTLGADTLYPCLSLFVMKSVPEEDQAMGAAVFQMVGQVGRTLGLALATAIQIAVTKRCQNDGMRTSLLEGYRAANWFGFGIAIGAILVAVYAFRGSGKVGKK